MDDLVTFLTARLGDLARIAEDGKAACAHVDLCNGAGGEWWDHFGHHVGPDFVLADIAAKRKIIALHKSRTVSVSEHEMFDPNALACSSCSKPDVVFADEYQPYPCPTLRLLAEPHAQHPGYREEWKP